jgi:hypothetical protein
VPLAFLAIADHFPTMVLQSVPFVKLAGIALQAHPNVKTALLVVSPQLILHSALPVQQVHIKTHQTHHPATIVVQALLMIIQIKYLMQAARHVKQGHGVPKVHQHVRTAHLVLLILMLGQMLLFTVYHAKLVHIPQVVNLFVLIAVPELIVLQHQLFLLMIVIPV